MRPQKHPIPGREQLLRDLFRNSLALALLKQTIIVANGPFVAAEDRPREAVPRYLRG